MKILLINTFSGLTSTGNLTYDIYKTNIENGDECVIAYGRKNTKNCDDTYFISNKVDYTLHAAWTRITDLNGFGSYRITKKFLKYIDEYKPDVVHIHNLHGYYINIKLLFEYLIKKNIPIVWTFHDCWPFTGHCPHYTNIGCEKWKTECYSCPKKRQHPASYVLDNSKLNYRMKKEIFTAPNRMVITPVSRWLEKEVKQSYFKNCQIEAVYNGVDLETFKPIKSGFKKKIGLIGKKLILGVAINWVPTKGLEDLIRLGEIISNEYKIIVVGLTKEQKERLPNYIFGIERTNNVHELVEIYSAADVFVNPSREETFGMVTAEALACGTPAIVYNVTASPELVDENTGRVVECGDIEGIYFAVKELISIDDISVNCINRAHELFDKKKNQNKYREIYKRLIEMK
jgi:glycosyltransferase involved in cell wall biosynthesis